MPKRLFDLSVAILGLLVLLPVFLMLAVWIKRDSAGPVFLRPRRAGRGGIPFRVFQFRWSAGESVGVADRFENIGDTRLTPSGRFLRKYKLDRLPQLLNVLRGEMSLVGPCPELVEKVESYNWHERRILALRPGLTDWASIWNCQEAAVLAGVPDPEEAYQRVIRTDKLDLQLQYLQTRSFWTDIKIIAATLIRVVHTRYRPAEIRNYPTFSQLRADVMRLVATEQIYRRAA